MRPLRLIARSSPLSLLQVKEAMALVPGTPFSLIETRSLGDKRKDISLMSPEAVPDFFTRELDRALLEGEADLAVHSAKDLPYPLPPGLETICLTAGDADKSDSLVSRSGKGLKALPPSARIGTSSSMRRAELLTLRPDLEVVSIRGTIEERIAQVDAGEVDALIVASCALRRLGLMGRATERLPFATHPLQGNLALTARAGRDDLKALFAPYDIRRRWGTVTLAGFGPGDPDLMTLACDRALREADVIFYDDLIDPTALVRYEAAEKVYVGKRSGHHSHEQAEINERLYRAALSGRQTVRLKGGDPMLLAHAREEIDYLGERLVSVRVIPGVTAAAGAAAATGIPLTHRGMASSVALINGHGRHTSEAEAQAEVEALTGAQAETLARALGADTLVYYMGAARASQIARDLIDGGRRPDEPATLVCNATRSDQRVWRTTLGRLRFTLVPPRLTPMLLIVGRVGTFYQAEERLLETATHLTLGPATGPDTTTHSPRPSLVIGERPTHQPLVRLTPLAPTAEGRETLLRLAEPGGYDGLIVTSPYSAHRLATALREVGMEPRDLPREGLTLCSVGPATSVALESEGFAPALEPEGEATAHALLETLRRRLADTEEPQRFLFPCSDRALPTLPEGLRRLGHRVDALPLYANSPMPGAAPLDLTGYDKVRFASPSGVEAFLALYGRLPLHCLLEAVGPTTFARLRKALTAQQAVR